MTLSFVTPITNNIQSHNYRPLILTAYLVLIMMICDIPLQLDDKHGSCPTC